MWKILPLLNTTHAFVSLGWEKYYPLKKQSEFSCTLLDFARHHPGIKISTISHVPAKGYKTPTSNFSFANNMECTTRVVDRFPAAENVPGYWYWDDLHVLGILNEEYNHEFVENMCPLQN